jgi:hypothetical protein
MNSSDLERELARLRPAPISRRLSDRISAQLGAAASRSGGSLANRLRLCGQRLALLATAAGLLVGAAMFFAEAPPSPVAPVATATVAAPSLLNYQRAFAQSSESLDALIDAHAARLGLSTGRSPQAGDGAGAFLPL